MTVPVFSERCAVVSDSLQPHEIYSPWKSPGHLENYPGVGSLSLLKGIFPIQVSHIAGRFFTSRATREAPLSPEAWLIPAAPLPQCPETLSL